MSTRRRVLLSRCWVVAVDALFVKHPLPITSYRALLPAGRNEDDGTIAHQIRMHGMRIPAFILQLLASQEYSSDDHEAELTTR